MIVLTYDLATVTGWAVGVSDSGTPPTPLESAAGQTIDYIESGSTRVAMPGSSLGVFAMSAERFFKEHLHRIRPQLVVFESPILRMETKIIILRKLYGLAYELEKLCSTYGIRVAEEYNAKFYKHMGVKARKSKERKAQMMEACRVHGWDPADDNEADALGLLHYTLTILNNQKPKEAVAGEGK